MAYTMASNHFFRSIVQKSSRLGGDLMAKSASVDIVYLATTTQRCRSFKELHIFHTVTEELSSTVRESLAALYM